MNGEDERVTEGTRTETTERVASQDELREAIALVQHEMNNPLAALLAEAQLLGMEPTLGAEQRAATRRITELTRRVIALVRELDVAVSGTRPAPTNEPSRQE